jgi:hypothetical protein
MTGRLAEALRCIDREGFFCPQINADKHGCFILSPLHIQGPRNSNIHIKNNDPRKTH